MIRLPLEKFVPGSNGQYSHQKSYYQTGWPEKMAETEREEALGCQNWQVTVGGKILEQW